MIAFVLLAVYRRAIALATTQVRRWEKLEWAGCGPSLVRLASMGATRKGGASGRTKPIIVHRWVTAASFDELLNLAAAGQDISLTFKSEVGEEWVWEELGCQQETSGKFIQLRSDAPKSDEDGRDQRAIVFEPWAGETVEVPWWRLESVALRESDH